MLTKMAHPNMPVCRICLTNDPLQVSLFSEYAQRKLLLTKIRVCLPITITHADTLPVTICSQCMVRLEQFYEYYCKSETSQRILTQGVGIITASGSSRTESYAVNGTAGSVSGVPTSIGTDTCVVSDNGGHGSGGGSITVADQMDPILTQSPQVKRPAVADEILSPGSTSPSGTLSFLLRGSKDRCKRKLKKKSATQNEFVSF